MNRSVILVGNGPSATQQRHGRLVDEFETVCRFNNFTTGGFEPAVGVKTDVWAVCDGNIRPRNQKEFRQVLFCVPLVRHDRPESWDWRPDEPFVLIPREVAEEVNRETGARENIWPSTGVLALAHFLRLTDVVVIHGFDHFGLDRHHYYPSKDKNWFHDGEAERKFVAKLLNTGRVRTLQQEFDDLK